MYQFRFAAKVDRGLVRSKNQDVARVRPDQGIAIVADGMGGHDDGQVASSNVVREIEHHLVNSGTSKVTAEEALEHLRQAIQVANQALARHPAYKQGPKQMGTTVVVAAFTHGSVIIGNVGDSRCYRLRSGSLEQLTQDHSYGAQLAQMGGADTAEGQKAARLWSHVLTRCLDGDPDVEPDIKIEQYEAGDTYLLCSDGLWGTVPEEHIKTILAATEDLDEVCQQLVGAAWTGGGLDNIGLALARVSQTTDDDPVRNKHD